jgi:lysozyme family protein
MPSGLDYLFFDISVNAGRQRAVTTFQKVLGVNVDGMFGEVTRDALNNYPDKAELIDKVSDERRRWYRNLKQFPIYGKGWLNRVDHSQKGAHSLLEGRTFDKTSVPSSKAKNVQPNGPTASPETSGATTGGLGTLTAILEQLRQNLEPYQYIIKPIMYVTLALTVLAAGYTAWSFYKKQKVQKAM